MDMKQRLVFVATAVVCLLILVFGMAIGAVDALITHYGLECLFIPVIIATAAFIFYRYIMSGDDAKLARLRRKSVVVSAKVLDVVSDEMTGYDSIVADGELACGKVRRTLYRLHCKYEDENVSWDFLSEYVFWNPLRYVGKNVDVYVEKRRPSNYHVDLQTLKAL